MNVHILYNPDVLYLVVNASDADTNPEQSTPAVPDELSGKLRQSTFYYRSQLNWF